MLKENSQQKILIVGLFLSPQNKGKILRTAADQLAELLLKNQVEIIKVSDKINHIKRLLDTIVTVVGKSPHYKIAIVPYYGSFRSLVWEIITTRLLKMLGKKVVLVMHGGSIPEKLKRKPTRYLKNIRRADVVVCPSHFFMHVLSQYNLQGKLIENVVNLSEYRFQPKKQFRPKLFWMRTLEDLYNPEMAVRVGAILAKKYDDFEMVMAGYDRGSLAMLTELAEKLGVAGKIHFPGYISLEQKLRYAQEYDFYICTNRVDNAPVSFIEMMALGLPIVSVNIGGIPFLIENNENGLLVDLDDDAAMADAIIGLIETPEKGIKMIKTALEFSKQFDEVPVLEKWKNLFIELDETNHKLVS